ncbi:MAG: sigma-54 dependent transcriptional regulator [Acidobacteriota bacterium]
MSSHRVLLVDDDRLFTRSIADLLKLDGLEVKEAGSLAEARRAAPGVDVLVLDNHLPDGEGLDLLQELRQQGWLPKVLLVTANPDLDNAIEALRQGIEDYLTKPLDVSQLRLAIHRCFRTLDLERLEDLEHRRRSEERDRVELIGGAEFETVRALVERASRSTSPVLLTGETGTDKSHIARAIHYRGRPESPFVAVNCAALPATLIEAELFGAVKGSYTGANEDRRGLFELADRGTIFLDEIGELPLELQVKLLGVLDDQRIRRLGGSEAIDVEVRVIAATNIDPEQATLAGTFRRDLYYRLNVLRIEVPPLRQRLGDLGPLIDSLLAGMGPAGDRSLAPGELSALATYHWPGNVRELRNVLERALILQETGDLRPAELLRNEAIASHEEPPTRDAQDEIVPLAELEKRHLLHAIAVCETQIEAAQRLGIGVATLRRKLTSYRSEEPARASEGAVIRSSLPA